MHSISKKSAIFFISESTSACLTMMTGLLIARFLGVSDFGRYTSALAFATMAAILIDAGMGMLAAKEIARGTPAALSTLDQIFTWRLGMMGVSCLLAPWVARLFLPAADVRFLAAGLIPGVLLMNTSDFFCWIFKGAQKATHCAALQITSRALLFGFSVVVVLRHWPVISLVCAYGAAGLAMAVVGYFQVFHSLRVPRLVGLTKTFFKTTLLDNYKLGAILILSVAFTRVDLMIVVRLRGAVEAGLFAAAGRIIDALRLIPMVVYSVYLPIFSSAHNQPRVLRARFLPAYDLLLALSTMLALFGTAWARILLQYLLGGAYVNATPCFQLLIWSSVLMFGNILMFSLHYALNDHRTPFLAIALALTTEIILDFLWLPHYGLVAAAWARLAAEGINSLTLALGFFRGQILSSLRLILRPALLMGSTALAFALSQRQPALFRFTLTWAALITMAILMGLGRLPAEEEVSVS